MLFRVRVEGILRILLPSPSFPLATTVRLGGKAVIYQLLTGPWHAGCFQSFDCEETIYAFNMR